MTNEGSRVLQQEAGRALVHTKETAIVVGGCTTIPFAQVACEVSKTVLGDNRCR